MASEVRWSPPAGSASAGGGGTFAPGSPSPASIAAVMRSTSCWVMDTEPPRCRPDKFNLYDIASLLVGHTLTPQGHTSNATEKGGPEMTDLTVRRSVTGDR